MRLLTAANLCALALCGCNPSSSGQKGNDARKAAPAQASVAFTMPEGTPSYLPSYPGALRTGNPGAYMAGEAVSRFSFQKMVVFETRDTPDMVHAFYRDTITKTGMFEVFAGGGLGAQMIGYGKKDHSNAPIIVTTNSWSRPNMLVQIQYTREPSKAQK